MLYCSHTYPIWAYDLVLGKSVGIGVFFALFGWHPTPRGGTRTSQTFLEKKETSPSFGATPNRLWNRAGVRLSRTHSHKSYDIRTNRLLRTNRTKFWTFQILWVAHYLALFAHLCDSVRQYVRLAVRINNILVRLKRSATNCNDMGE